MYTYWKIERTPFENNAWVDASSTVIDGFYDPIFRDNIGDGKDTFDFKLTNFNGEYDDYFNIGDKILIYRKVNSTTVASSDLLVTGIIQDISPTVDNRSNRIKITGTNFSETLMRAITFVDGNGVTLDQFIQNALNVVTNFNDNFKVTWNTNNPSTKTDGNSFPQVYTKWYNKSLLQLLEDYSTNKLTEDGNYYWYVDKDNTLVWGPRTNDAIDTFNTSTDTYKSLKTKKDLKGVVNFAIVKGGLTPGGKSVSVRVDNAASRVKHGFKPKIIVSKAKYIRALINEDQLKHGGTDSDYPQAYPFTTSWTCNVTSYNSPASTEGSTVEVSSDTEYNTILEREAKFQLKQEGQQYLDFRKNGKLQVTIELEPDTLWALGGVIECTISSLNFTNKPMRVESREFSNNSIRYTLIEDVGTV